MFSLSADILWHMFVGVFCCYRAIEDLPTVLGGSTFCSVQLVVYSEVCLHRYVFVVSRSLLSPKEILDALKSFRLISVMTTNSEAQRLRKTKGRYWAQLTSQDVSTKNMKHVWVSYLNSFAKFQESISQ